MEVIPAEQLVHVSVPETAGHELGGSSPGPVDVEPQSLFDPRVDCRPSFLHIWQLQGYNTWRRPDMEDMQRITSSVSETLNPAVCSFSVRICLNSLLRAKPQPDLLPFPLAELQILTVWSLLPDAR